MPERIIKLRETVKELETELQSLDSMDESTRQVLEEAIREIQAALEIDHPDEFEKGAFGDRLHEAAERFETSHPTLFGILRRTIDALGQMGI